MNIIDTHAHLFWEKFQHDADEVAKRAVSAGVTTIINVGVDALTSEMALKQIQGKLGWTPNLETFSTIGIHPHEAVKYSIDPDVSIQKDIDRLEDIYQSNTSKVIAVGECGLDFLLENNSDAPPTTLSFEEIKALQIKLFQAHIDLAKKLKLPLLIHIRDDRSKDLENTDAFNEAFKLIEGSKGIFHCYSGLAHNTKYILQSTDFLISFAGNLTYPKNYFLREDLANITLDRIVVETDCPFLPPQMMRGQRNEPANILEVVKAIALAKGLTIEEVAKATEENTRQLLKI